MSDKPGFFRSYAAVIGCFLMIMAAALVVAGFGVFFTPISSQFGWTHTETSGAFSFSMIMSGVLGIVAGRLSDKFNPRLLILICGILEGLACVLLSFMSSLWQLYFYYGILIGAGMANIPPMIALVTKYYTRRRGVMTGITLAGAGVGGIAAPPLGLYFISTYGWQTAYMIMGGIILAVVALSGFFLYYSKTGSRPLEDGVPSGASAAARVKEINLKQSMRTGSFWLLGIIIFCFSFNAQALTVHLVPGADDLAISAGTAAGLLSMISLTNMLSSFSMGIVADRIGSFFSIVISQICMLVGLLLLLFVREVWALYLFAIMFGIGWGVMNLSRSTIIVDLFGLVSYGVISGVISLFLSIGGTLGPIAGGYIYDLTQHYQYAFILLAGLALVSLILTFPLKSRVKRF
jgi:MFS family permease